MEFRVLGPFEATDGMTPLRLGGPKPRALLARLLIDVNRTVSVRRLVEDLWGDDVPDSAVKMVQIHVSHLRKVLPPGILRTQPPGYVLDADPESVDLTRFLRLREEGRSALVGGDPARASRLLAAALALWRGPALDEFDEPFARVEAARLEELRLVCLENRIEADLEAGRHADVVGELEALVARHPLRETLHGQLMLALYRSGRQAEALSAYDRFRRTLDEELGIEPYEALKQLQVQILTQDRDLSPARQAVRVPTTPRRVAATTGIVGRDAELEQLEVALDEAEAGRGGVVLVSGRPGIGKTRLVEELGERGRARGATVLSGRCIQLVGSVLPYLPVVDALKPLCGSPELEDIAGDLQELPRLMPDIAGPPPQAEGADLQLRLFKEMLTVIGHLSNEAPIVLVLEDLHWADESTLDLVAFLAHAMRDRRVLMVGTYRSGETPEGDHLRRMTSGLLGTRAAIPLPLGPLDREAIETLLTAEGDGAASQEMVVAIAEAAEGNPFFARELLSAVRRGEAALPPALRDVLLADVARLPAKAQSVVRVASAAGRDVSFGLLAAVVPLDALELAEALRQAVEHDILVPDQAAGTFHFRHALFADAVYRALLPGERELLHEHLARALDDATGSAASRMTTAELAQHWAAAGRAVEALAASLQAAREAQAVSGLSEALRHVERVLELWDRVPAAEELAGIGLPAIIQWAGDLAGLSVQREDAVDARLLVGMLGPGDSLDATTVAARLKIDPSVARATLAALEREGLVVHAGDGGFRVARLEVTEARRLYPSVVVLESLAIRQAPPFDRAALDGLRAANARMRSASDDPAAAVTADDDFHRRLTAACGNQHLLDALRPIRRALLRYERIYMVEPARIERSAEQHDAIIEALEWGDHAEAAQLVRENLGRGLPDLTEALER